MPTHRSLPAPRVHLTLPADLLTILDARAARERVPRAALIVSTLSLAAEAWGPSPSLGLSPGPPGPATAPSRRRPGPRAHRGLEPAPAWPAACPCGKLVGEHEAEDIGDDLLRCPHCGALLD